MGDAAPACGTVGCIAGWITFIADRRVKASDDYDIANRAADLLGLNLDKTYGMTPALFRNGLPDLRNTKPGTKAHADAVVARIRKYQRDNNAHLIETPVVPA